MIAALLLITPSAIGPIHSGAAADKRTLRALFPGATVRDTVDGYEDSSWPTLSVFVGKRKLLEVTACKDSGEICLVKSRVARTARIRPGDFYRSLSEQNRIVGCSGGMEQESGLEICRDAEAPNILVVFGGKSKLDIPDADDLRHYKVVELRWFKPHLPK